jgi:hypothetical protein
MDCPFPKTTVYLFDRISDAAIYFGIEYGTLPSQTNEYAADIALGWSQTN